MDWPTLANIIREVDGNHDLGAGELAERILTHPRFQQPVLREALDAIEKALAIGGTSYDGDSWYAHDAGLGTYDEMDAALAAGREALATLRALASRLSSPEEKR